MAQAAVEVRGASLESAPAGMRAADIDAKFHRMLEVDKNSPEFAELWAAVDQYLDAAVAEQKSAAA